MRTAAPLRDSGPPGRLAFDGSAAGSVRRAAVAPPVSSPGRPVSRVHRPKRPVLAIEKFPVTALLGLEYGALVVYPALVHHTQPERLMVAVCTVAVLIAFAAEFLISWLPRPQTLRSAPHLNRRAATVVLTIGAIAQLGLVLGGNVSYATQATGGSRSHLASLFSPLSSWLLFGVVMHLWLWRQGQIRRCTTWAILAFAGLVQVAVLERTTVSAGLASFALAVLFVATVVGFIRFRWVVVVIALIPIVWPPLYAFRNDLRHRQVVSYSATGQASASRRLREDLNFAVMLRLPELPDGSLMPSASTLVQFALLPRVVDPGRGTLNTASELDVATGGPSTSTATFTSLGDAYALQGWVGVGTFTLLATLAMALALRRRSVWGYAIAGLLVMSMLWIEASWPDLLAGITQSLLSLLVAFGLVVVLSRVKFGPRLARQGVQGRCPSLRAAPAWATAATNLQRVRHAVETPDGQPDFGRIAIGDISILWTTADSSHQRPGRAVRASPKAAPVPSLARIVRTATILNVVASAAAAVGGLIAARYLGAAIKGEYAAATAWFGAGLVLGEIGQQTAIVYYIAHDAARAKDYLRTSRNIMLVTGVVAALGGVGAGPGAISWSSRRNVGVSHSVPVRSPRLRER